MANIRFREAPRPAGTKLLTLLQIEYESFRKHEETQFKELVADKRRRRFRLERLDMDHAVMFVSLSGNCVRVVWSPIEVVVRGGTKVVQCTTSRQFRLPYGEEFDPLAVQDLAHKMGLHFHGLPSKEQWIRDTYGEGRR